MKLTISTRSGPNFDSDFNLNLNFRSTLFVVVRMSPQVVLPIVRELLLTDSHIVLKEVQHLVAVQLIEEDHPE